MHGVELQSDGPTKMRGTINKDEGRHSCQTQTTPANKLLHRKQLLHQFPSPQVLWCSKIVFYYLPNPSLQFLFLGWGKRSRQYDRWHNDNTLWLLWIWNWAFLFDSILCWINEIFKQVSCTSVTSASQQSTDEQLMGRKTTLSSNRMMIKLPSKFFKRMVNSWYVHFMKAIEINFVQGIH